MANDLIEFSKEEKQVIMQQYFPQGTTSEQMQFCIAVAKELGLNPITKEIWFIERKSKVNNQWVTKIEPMCGRDSYLKIAHRSGKFGGIETSSKIESVAKMENGQWVETKDLVATSNVFIKGIDAPFTATVNYNEYVQKKNDGNPTKFWNEKPHTMLKKVAESQALRKAFNISGIYDESEIRIENPNDMPTIERKTNSEAIDAEIEVPPITEKELKSRLSLKLRALDFSDTDMIAFVDKFKLLEDLELLQDVLVNKDMLMDFVKQFEDELEEMNNQGNE